MIADHPSVKIRRLFAGMRCAGIDDIDIAGGDGIAFAVDDVHAASAGIQHELDTLMRMIVKGRDVAMEFDLDVAVSRVPGEMFYHAPPSGYNAGNQRSTM